MRILAHKINLKDKLIDKEGFKNKINKNNIKMIIFPIE
jgi:hypothetical protein